MKRSMLMGLVVAVAASSAVAATPKKVAKKVGTTAPVVGTVGLGKTESPTPESSNVAPKVETATAVAAPATPAAQSTTPATTAAAPAKKFSGDVTLWNEMNISEVSDETKRDSAQLATSDVYLRLRYALTDKVRLGFGQDISHNGFNNMGEDSRKNLVVYYDPFVSISQGKIATLPGDINFGSAARAYLPVSQGSRDAGLITQLNLYAIFSKDFTEKFNVSLTLRPRFYVNTASVYANSMKGDKVTATNNFVIQNWLAATYSFTDALSVYQNVGAFETLKNGGSLNGKSVEATSSTAIYAETGVSYDLTKDFNLAAGIVTADRDARKAALTVYGEETNAFLSGTAKF